MLNKKLISIKLGKESQKGMSATKGSMVRERNYVKTLNIVVI